MAPRVSRVHPPVQSDASLTTLALRMDPPTYPSQAITRIRTKRILLWIIDETPTICMARVAPLLAINHAWIAKQAHLRIEMFWIQLIILDPGKVLYRRPSRQMLCQQRASCRRVLIWPVADLKLVSEVPFG